MNALTELQNQEIARLKKAYAELKRKHADEIAAKDRLIAELQGRSLSEEARRALQFLNEARGAAYADAVARALNMDTPRADALLGRLVQSEHIYQTPNFPPRFEIARKGREAIEDLPDPGRVPPPATGVRENSS